MSIKEELHACPWCWFFTLKKWVFSCCIICNYRPNQFSKFFPVEKYQFESHRNEESLYKIQSKTLKSLPIKSDKLNISLRNTWKCDLNSPILICLNDKEYEEEKVYEFFTRHPFWKPLKDDNKLNIVELYKWYTEILKKSSLLELNKEWYILITDSELDKTVETINTWVPLHMCPACWFETLSWGLSWYDICPICFWEDDLWWVCNPCYWYWPNLESLLEVQECINKYITIKTKEYHWYKRNLNWKTINIEEIINKEKPFIEKWFYDKVLWNCNNDYYRKLFKEAQKYNPTKY